MVGFVGSRRVHETAKQRGGDLTAGRGDPVFAGDDAAGCRWPVATARWFI